MNGDKDRVSETFKNKTIFISGATGFLGKLLVEKLLRVTEVKRLYLLIRQKRGKTPKDRFTEIYNHVLFERIREECPKAIDKCVIITGDVSETDLGIDQQDREILKKEVEFIFHSAATTRFDETVWNAMVMNIRGTKYMLDLAKECKNLKCFIHVSTAYAFPKEDVLYERAYEPAANPNEVLNSINWLKKDTLNKITKELLGDDIPNTYTLSKSLAEGLVNEEFGKLPIIIVRPAVVIPTCKEPLPGYFNNLQSPMGLFLGAGKGVIRSMYMDSKSYANLIPADCCINIMLVSVWDYMSSSVNPKQSVFNLCVPEEDVKVNWEEIVEIGKDVVATRVPFNNIIWYPGGALTNSRIYHNINVILFQIIPAIFLDGLLMCLGYKPILISINQRLRKGQEMFEYYTTKAWKFNLDYFLSMRKKLNAKEKQVYQVDAEGVDLKEYFANSILYSRRHIFKETDDMLPAAKRNMKIFFVLDRIFKIGFFILVVYYLYKLLC